jgi:hypothetical protein
MPSTDPTLLVRDLKRRLGKHHRRSPNVSNRAFQFPPTIGQYLVGMPLAWGRLSSYGVAIDIGNPPIDCTRFYSACNQTRWSWITQDVVGLLFGIFQVDGGHLVFDG